MMYLFEESRRLTPKHDERLPTPQRPRRQSTPDWGSDPMEILMAKQEAERASAERYKSKF